MPLAIDPTVLTAIGAFLAGIGSVMGGFAALYYARKRAAEDARKAGKGAADDADGG